MTLPYKDYSRFCVSANIFPTANHNNATKFIPIQERFMLNKLQAVANRFEELCAKSEQPDFYADPKKAAKLLREKNDLEPIVETFQAYQKAETAMSDALELMSDPEMKELAQEEFTAAKTAKEDLFDKLPILLLPKP